MKTIRKSFPKTTVRWSKLAVENGKVIPTDQPPVEFFGEKITLSKAEKHLKAATKDQFVITAIEAVDELREISFADFIAHSSIVETPATPEQAKA